MAAEAARVVEEEEVAARFTKRIARIGSAVARELGLAAVLDVILDEAIHTLEAHFAYVSLADEEQRTLKLTAKRNLPEELERQLSTVTFDAPLVAARAASTRESQLISSLADLKGGSALTQELLKQTRCESVVAFPLVARNRLFGVLTFGFTSRHDFTPEDGAALDTCAEIFSFSIANATLYEEEHLLRSLFEAIGNATVSMAQELELRSVLQTIVDRAREVVNAEYAALGIFAGSQLPFEPWVFSGLTTEQELKVGKHPRPVGMLGEILAGGRGIRIDDVRDHPAFKGVPLHHPNVRSFLGVPVVYDGKVIGDMYFANKHEAPGFTAEDERAVALLATQVGTVLYRSRQWGQLATERERFRTIVDNAPHGVIFVDETGEMIVNRRAIELVGQKVERVGTYAGALLTPEGRAIPRDDWPVQRAMRGELVPPRELLLQRPDGKVLPVLVSAIRVSEDAQSKGALVLFEDISTLKELQCRREEWATVITHDLRQPLNVMTMCIGLLQRMAASPDPEQLRKAAGRLKGAVTSLNRMVGDLTDVSLIETKHLTLERKPIQLDTLVQDLVEQHRPSRPDCDILLTIRDPIPPIEADPTRIEQVFTNLLANALKYCDAATTVDVDLQATKDAVSLRISNRGVGVAPEDLPRIFDRYFRTLHARTTKPTRGLGLGLYIAKGLVEAHGGTILASSQPGKTTTFEVVLPIVQLH